MKKLVTIFLGLIIASIFATTVSAEEYEVQKGDTLWDIAKEHDTTVKTLMNENGLNSSLIFPKQVLNINESEEEYYRVEKGDTLSEISKAYGEHVTVADLRAWNDLQSDLIMTGQELLVSGDKIESQLTVKQVNQTPNTDNQSAKSKTVSVASTEVTEKEEPESKEKTGSEVESKSSVEDKSTPNEKPEGKLLTVEATAYTAYCNGCSGVTATGINLRENPNAKVIAVDPNLIPLGSKVYVEGYGYAVAGDTGGAIKGNKIDIHLPTKDQAYSWGRRTVEVTIVE